MQLDNKVVPCYAESALRSDFYPAEDCYAYCWRPDSHEKPDQHKINIALSGPKTEAICFRAFLHSIWQIYRRNIEMKKGILMFVHNKCGCELEGDIAQENMNTAEGKVESYRPWSRGVYPLSCHATNRNQVILVTCNHPSLWAGSSRPAQRTAMLRPLPPHFHPIAGDGPRTPADYSAPHPGRASAAVRLSYRPVAPGQRRSYSTETDNKYRPAFVL